MLYSILLFRLSVIQFRRLKSICRKKSHAPISQARIRVCPSRVSNQPGSRGEDAVNEWYGSSVIVKVSNYVDAYRVKAQYAKDVHELSGRSTRSGTTEFVNRGILKILNVGCDDQLLDIGCGDGCLLKLASLEGFHHTTGLAGTEEEAARLRKLGLNVRQGLSDCLPIADNSCDVVVCNSVLLIVTREKIPASLSEIARVAKPGARIYIGEVPSARELARVPRHQTVSSMLGYLLRTHGLRTLAGSCRTLAWRALRREPIILNQAPIIEFYAEPEEFVALASCYGMNLERYFRHRDLDERGNVRMSETRMNYLFTKPSRRPTNAPPS